MRINDLKEFLERTVTLRMASGEIAKVKITFIDEEDADIMAAVVETSMPDRYRNACAVYTFAAADIESAEITE